MSELISKELIQAINATGVDEKQKQDDQTKSLAAAIMYASGAKIMFVEKLHCRIGGHIEF
jgi:hypothetical protein